MPAPQSPSPSHQDRLRLIAFRQIIQLFLSLHSRMTLPQALTFLQVMSTQGVTVSTLATYRGVELHTLSKHLRDLGPPRPHGRPTYDLITTTAHSYDGRLRRVVLTERGTAIAKEIAAILGRAHGRWGPSLGTHDQPAQTERRIALRKTRERGSRLSGGGGRCMEAPTLQKTP